MPIFSYFAVVGSVLVALLFAADATLPKSATPVVVTSSLYGMPKPWHPDPTPILATAPAPAPDMASEAVLAAAPKTAPVNERSATADTAPRRSAWSPASRRRTTHGRTTLGRAIAIRSAKTTLGREAATRPAWAECSGGSETFSIK
jgi:hypothetical protein